MSLSYTSSFPLQSASNANDDLSAIQQRLAAHEAERKPLPPSRRRSELDRLIARDLADLCECYRRRSGSPMRAA